jgi:hypothetical protein
MLTNTAKLEKVKPVDSILRCFKLLTQLKYFSWVNSILNKL